jgi:hypothetical protein
MGSEQVTKLRTLLRRYISGELDTSQFCDAFERAYNFEVAKADLNRIEGEAFAELFDKVVFYSPYPDERARIPNYRSEREIMEAAKRTAAKLGL